MAWMEGWRRGLVAAGLGIVALAAAAQDIPGYPKDVYAADFREMARVPRYCQYTLVFRDAIPGNTDKAAMFNAWKAQVGESFVHMHHYCAGLIKMDRALFRSRDRQSRTFYLNDAIIEYDYVINRVPDEYVLLPEILTKKGEALMHLERDPLAIFTFERAIELKRDYWPPYAHLSDHYLKAGDRKKARETLEAGLAADPAATALRRRLAELDGKKPQ